MKGGKKSVAIVDDDEAVLEAFTAFLDAMGYESFAFSSGSALLDSADKLNIELVLTDINMPGMTGLELQDILKSRYPTLPVIMMTALTDDVLKKRALANGAADLLQKPVMADDLVRSIEAA